MFYFLVDEKIELKFLAYLFEINNFETCFKDAKAAILTMKMLTDGKNQIQDPGSEMNIPELRISFLGKNT